MRAIRYHEFGDPSVLELETVERLSPDADEVLVATRAIGVNPCDTLRRQGLWGDELPLIPGSDVAGVVERVGERVTRFDVGDRVFGTIPHLNVSGARGDRQGTYAEFVVAREDRLARLPDDVGFDVGAGLGLVGITAWRALLHFGDLEPGQTCLVHGGSGGVGHVAVQLAATLGATVVATASADHAPTVAELGADVVLDYRRDDLRDAVTDAASGGVDVVLDHMLGEYAQFDIDVSAYGGTVVAIGGNYDSPVIEDLTAAIGKDLTIQPMDMFNEPNIDVVLERLAHLLDVGRLTVEVARTYDLGDAAEAQRAVVEDSFPGKLVLVP
ncbi:zinc-binding alcohol dehydrogenase family protein [Halomarina halobia]|uniref:Zinc-binding alcohol dehydrogenase family protein n=1 Tax=Halomarina halobia TaxID=3033386 RepID=A0ABD6AD03_9EURY|nr:NADPH:quinone reductase [Halomarina sp. PSR21]